LSFATEDDAAADWNNLTANDKLKFVENWNDDKNNDDRSLSDLSFYDSTKDSFNIDYDDVPTCENPLTHYAATDAKAAENQNVLMIHNSYDNRGTAQKYTASSQITLSAGTAAEVSMWVKTSDLTYANNATGETQDVIGLRGAYIGITQQIGSVSLDTLYVKNIDTEAINTSGENNGWVKYTFYLNGSSYSETNFKIVLGLGMSGGSNRMEYVSGYAFFDDVVCTTMRSEEFDQKVTDAGISSSVIGLSATEEDKIFRADTAHKSVFNYAIDLDKSVNAFVDYTLASATTSITKESSGADGKEYVSAQDPSNPTAIVYQPLGFDTTNDVNGLFANRAAIAAVDPQNAYLNSFLNNTFKDDSLFKDKQTLLLLSADGAAYTAELPTITVPGFDELNPEQNRMVISFFVKTSNMKGKTSASVTLFDVNNKSNSTTISAIDTSAAGTVNVDSATGQDEDADIYEGWQQCFFFVENPTTENKTFAIRVNLGPETVLDKARTDFYPGYAAFTSFQYRTISKTEYSYAKTGTYTAIISLEDAEEERSPASFTDATSIGKNIENTLADAADYRGVYGGSAYVSRTGTDKTVNDYAYAGLMNSKYIDEYLNQAAGDADYWLNKVNASADKPFLESLFGDATQPMLVYNDGVKSYGYIGKSQTISTGTLKAVSVRVKVSGNATAYVYLSDMDDVDLETSLSIGRNVSYWYDKDGNVCDKDPNADGFSTKVNVAFKLQPNGLYKVNPNWNKASTVDANAYFANYANYAEDDNKNKVVAENGVSYDYTSKWRNDGNDGIAFYYKDGAYYADSNYQTRVYDFSAVSALPVRYTATESKSLVATVENTAGAWKTVTFFVKAGVAEKNFRLEVWSGSRDGSVVNEAGSYVLFDYNSYGEFTDDTY
ncbi:MAG: hypothetical protein IJV80_05455, partial [Clostridia bacterium]|nr:hypothetical protein [Clostridia bacterium]